MHRHRLRLPQAADTTALPRFDDLTHRLRQLNSLVPGQIDVVGLELKTAFLARSKDWPGSDVALQKATTRPASEPALLLLWRALCRQDSSETENLRVASVLIGAQAKSARGWMTTHPSTDGSVTVFCSPNDRARSGALLERFTSQTLCPIAAGLAIYATFILAHPVQDGNGRLARARLLGALGAHGVLSRPAFPLGPAFHCHGGVVVGAMRDLSETGDWSSCLLRLSEILVSACDLAETVLDRTCKLAPRLQR